MSQLSPETLERRRRTHRTLIGVILATLPCYFCGIVLLVGFSGQQPRTPTPTVTPVLITATEAGGTPTLTPTNTLTITPGGPTLTLRATPTQFNPPTNTPTPTLTGTIDLNATATFNALLTEGAIFLTQTLQGNQTATANAHATATANAWATATAAASATAGANRPPRAVRDDVTTAQGTPVTVNVLANDSDPDGDPLSIIAFDAVSAGGGTVTCSAPNCTYTPPLAFAGEDSFSYTISDGRGGTDSARVRVTVTPAANNPPVANDDAATTTKNNAVTINVLANDSDPDGDPLQITGYDAASANGGVVSCSSGGCLYTPPTDFDGSDSFSYTISDGRGGTDSATVTVTVNP